MSDKGRRESARRARRLRTAGKSAVIVLCVLTGALAAVALLQT